MAYKDKDKQREAVKAATQRYRAKKGDSALLGSKDGSKNARGLPVVDKVSDTRPVIPSCDTPDVIPKDIKCITIGDQARSMKTMAMLHSATSKRGKDIKCFEEFVNRTAKAVTSTALKLDAVLSGVVTGKPGDADYNGICKPEWIKKRKGAAL